MTILRLSVRALLDHARLALVMALAVAVPLACYLTLGAYHAGLAGRYPQSSAAFLVVQLSGSFGEFYGSRLPAELSAELLAAGASRVIPEIHTVVGTTAGDAVLLRGIPLDSYPLVEEFSLVAGRPLLPGDPPRLAMLGARLAEARGLLPGDTIQIRGRDFQVVGIFDVPTYVANEAWIALADAQALLGWGTDVSIYKIPSGETYAAGDALPGGISVVKPGASSATLLNEWEPFFGLIELVLNALGLAAAIALASILWRLAWLQRRELAILRSLGFGRRGLAAYLLVQGVVITLLGFVFGCLGAWLVGALTAIRTAGLSIHAHFDLQVILASLGFAALLALAGAAVPAWWLNRLNLALLLRSE
jgi:ABC-type lipoprotein release transport system permease subunit